MSKRGQKLKIPARLEKFYKKKPSPARPENFYKNESPIKHSFFFKARPGPVSVRAGIFEDRVWPARPLQVFNIQLRFTK
jgi:hypothetical protein